MKKRWAVRFHLKRIGIRQCILASVRNKTFVFFPFRTQLIRKLACCAPRPRGNGILKKDNINSRPFHENWFSNWAVLVLGNRKLVTKCHDNSDHSHVRNADLCIVVKVVFVHCRGSKRQKKFWDFGNFFCACWRGWVCQQLKKWTGPANSRSPVIFCFFGMLLNTNSKRTAQRDGLDMLRKKDCLFAYCVNPSTFSYWRGLFLPGQLPPSCPSSNETRTQGPCTVEKSD